MGKNYNEAGMNKVLGLMRELSSNSEALGKEKIKEEQLNKSALAKEIKKVEELKASRKKEEYIKAMTEADFKAFKDYNDLEEYKDKK